MITENTPQWKVKLFIILSLLILVVLVLGFLYFAPTIEPTSGVDLEDVPLQTSTIVQIDPLVIPAGPILPPIEPIDPIRGNLDAPITIIYFADFNCPFCHEMKGVWQQILDEYGDDVRIVWKDLLVYEHSLGFHKAARCAQLQGGFWEYYDEIWEYDFGTSVSTGLIDIADQIGLDVDSFTQCLASGEIEQVVFGAAQQSLSVGISEAPSYFIGDEYYSGFKDIEEIREIIDRQLGR